MLLGILQGVTEWLPVSSSGHLAIFQFYFEEEPPILFDIILHLGSLCVILYIMRDEVRQVIIALPNFLKGLRSDKAVAPKIPIAMPLTKSLRVLSISIFASTNNI